MIKKLVTCGMIIKSAEFIRDYLNDLKEDESDLQFVEYIEYSKKMILKLKNIEKEWKENR